jgi:hypothetical protein
MLKRVIGISLALSSVFLVASCDTGDDSDDNSPPLLLAPLVIAPAGVSTGSVAPSGPQSIAYEPGREVAHGPVDSAGNTPDSKGVVRSSGGSHRSAQLSPSGAPTASQAYRLPTVLNRGALP